jgi:hypothetical protein
MRNENSMSQSENAGRHDFAIRAALLYAVVGVAWILFSNAALGWLTSDTELFNQLNVFKDVLFIATSTLALWLVLHRVARKQPGQVGKVQGEEKSESHVRMPWLSVLVAGIAIIGLALAAITYTLNQQEQQELARLQAVANLKANQLNNWLQERRKEVNFFTDAGHLTAVYQSWQGRHDVASGVRLRRDLSDFIKHNRFGGIQLLDPEAEHVIWKSEGMHDTISPQIRAAVRQAQLEPRPIPFGPYRDADNHLYLNYAVALPPLDAKAGPLISPGSGTIMRLGRYAIWIGRDTLQSGIEDCL